MRIDLSTRQWVFLLVGFLFVLYCLFQARYLIMGPQVSIEGLEDGVVVSSPVVTLEGKARNVAWLSLNGRQIYTDENGLWSEKLIVGEGTSIMTVRGTDRFGRVREDQVRIVLNQI